MVTKTYRNNRNINKYLIVRQYKDGHTVIKQYMEWSNGVRNYTGSSLRSKNGKFVRISKSTLTDLLDDYTIINIVKYGA